MPRRKREMKKTLAEAGAFFGVTEKTIRTWHTQGCPCKGGPYDLYLIAEWWARERQHGSQGNSLEADLKLRRLEQQCKSDELDYAERIDELMPRANVDLIFNLTAAEIRKAGELLQRQFGDDAQLILLEALESVGHILSQRLRNE